MLEEGIIEPSHSPWTSQAFVVSPENRKKRMVIDHSQTINRFTLLDVYPLPRIDNMIEKIAKKGFIVFWTLKVPAISINYKTYVAFEASDKLYQFRRLLFDVTNRVASF